MPRVKTRKRTVSRPKVIQKPGPHQKLCPKCKSLVSHEIQRCPFCGKAPWLWHPNSRLFLVAVVICIFLFVLFPLITNREKPYRVPVSDAP